MISEMTFEDRRIIHLLRLTLNLSPALEPEADGDERAPDWESLVKASIRHGVFLIVLPLLLQKKHCCPEEIRDSLKTRARILLSQSLQMSAELLRICETLASSGLAAIPFKGPTLSCAVYGQADRRIFGDLDILVKREEVGQVLHCLATMGYSPLISLDAEQLKRYIAFEDDLQLSHGNGTVVEIHWEATGRYTVIPMDYAYLEPRSVQAEFHGKTVSQFGSEDLLIYLCLHGARHSWERLEWLFSLACLLRNQSVGSLAAVIERAAGMKCRRLVIHSLLLACEIFAIELPGRVGEKLRRDRVCVRLLPAAVEEIFPLSHSVGGPRGGNRFRSAQFCLRDDLGDLFNYLIRQLFWLRIADVQFITLPSVLFPLYYGIRPIRLVLKGLKML